MKAWKQLPFALLLFALISGVAGLTGCASLEAPAKESLLTAAGFHTKSPTTSRQIAFYNQLTPYKVQRHVVKDRVVYTYADQKNNLVYFGGEKAYQRYKELGLKQQIAEDQLNAAEMNEESALDWGGWGPWGGFYP